jgi:hypothetical protein
LKRISLSSFPGLGVRRSRPFLLAFVATFAAGALLIVGFNAWVNPWGNCGRVKYPGVYNDRLAKSDYLDGLPPDRLPRAIVLGSSNEMRFSPATIQAALNLSAFNFAVFWGRTDDFLCITRHLVHDLHHRPALLIIGMDTWTFREGENEHPVFPGVSRLLLNTPQLVKNHPDVSPVPLYWAKFIDAFSGEQLKLSWKLLHQGKPRGAQPPLGASEFFAPDGARILFYDVYGPDPHKNIFADVEAGRYPITKYLQRLKDKGRIREMVHFNSYDFEGFSAQRIRYLDLLLDLCQREGIKVVFVMNPVHPVFWDVIAAQTPHLKNIEKLRALLKDLSKRYPAVVAVIDATRIQNFDGDPEGFFDEIHPSTHNCDLIIDRIARAVSRP